MEQEYFASNGDNFIVRSLSDKDISASSALLTKVAEEMHKKNHSTYIHSKSEEEVQAIISDNSNKLAGIFLLDEFGNEIQLVAEMGYFGVDENSSRDAEDATLPFFNAEHIPNSEIDYIGSVCVDEGFRGQGFFQHMDKFLETNSEKKYSVAMVDTSNYKSFGHFLDNKFCLTQKTIDTADGGDILYLIKDKNFSVYAMNSDAKLSVNDEDYNQQMESLVNRGYIGCGYDKGSKSIVFQRNARVLNRFGCNGVGRPVMSRSGNKFMEGVVYA